MVACLTVYSRHQPTVRRFLDQDREYLLGRSADCDLRFDDPSLSRSHARLRHANDGWELEDLGSKNGVRINGTGVRKAGLADGAWLSLGDLLARFELVSDDYEAEAERRGAALWETSMQLSRTLRPELGLDGLLARLLDSALELAGTERGFVMLGDDAENLEIRCSRPPRQQTFEGSQTAARRAVATAAPVLTNDAGADVLLADQPSVVVGGIRALASLPLKIDTRVIGVLYLDSRQPGKVFTELDIEILTALAEHAALAIGVTQVNEDIELLKRKLPAQISRDSRPDPALLRLLKSKLPKVDRTRSDPPAP